MTTDVRRVLAWTLGVPFFLLPVPLTVDAPDIFGGYGIHLRQGLLLAVLGLALGVAMVHGASARQWLRERPALDSWLTRGAWVVGLLLFSLILATACSASGRQLARFLGALPLGVSRAHAPEVPHPAVVLALMLTFGRLAWRRPDTSVVRPLAAVALVLQGACWLHANRFTTAEVPLTVVLLTALLVLVGWEWLRRPSRLGDSIGWAVVFGAVFAVCLATMTHLVAALSLIPDGPPARPLAVVGALVGASVLVWALRRGLTALPVPSGEQAVVGMRVLAMRAPLIASLLIFATVTSTLAMVTGGLLAELFGSPSALGRWAPTDLPHAVLVAWWLLFLRVGAGLRTRGDLLRLAAAVSLGFALLVLGRTREVAEPMQLMQSYGLVFGALLLATAVVPRLQAVGRGRLVLGALIATGPLAAAPVVARYIVSVGVGGEVSPWLCLGLGLVPALAVPWLALRFASPDPTAPLALGALVVRLPLLAVALVLPIYITVHAGLRPGTFALAVALIAGLLALSRARTGSLGPLPVPVALWLLFYAGFLQTAVFKLGPSAARCASILQDTSARVLLNRHAEGGDYLDVYPYDAIPLPGRSTVLTSFKRIDKRGGFVEVIDSAQPAQRARTTVRREGVGGPLWPERIVTDPATGNALVQVIGVGAHGLWELLPQGGPGAVEPVTVGRRIPLQYEPGNPAVDPARRTLALTYVPNREGGNPLVEVFDLDTLSPKDDTGDVTHRMMQMADFVETDRGTGRHYAPTLFDFVRFAVIEVLPDLRLGRHRETFHPVIGLAADPDQGRLFLTNPLAGVMEVLDLATFAHVQTTEVGLFPRDVAHDPGRQRLYVANYGDGSVVTFSTAGGRLEEVARAEVGWLLRGLGVDEASGRVVAASGCGVFEIAGAEGVLP